MLLSGSWLAFALATLAFACMPGPAMLYMTAQTLVHGRHAGLMAALGVHLGCYVHVAAAAVGLSALLYQAPQAYLALKLLGAFYLIWLGVTKLLEWRRKPDSQWNTAPAVFRDSVIVEILNPKTAVFFLTFLPQFVDPAAATPAWLQFLVLGVLVNVAFSAGDLAAVMLSSLTLGRVAAGGYDRHVSVVSGTILIGLGIVLVRSV